MFFNSNVTKATLREYEEEMLVRTQLTTLLQSFCKFVSSMIIFKTIKYLEHNFKYFVNLSFIHDYFQNYPIFRSHSLRRYSQHQYVNSWSSHRDTSWSSLPSCACPGESPRGVLMKLSVSDSTPSPPSDSGPNDTYTLSTHPPGDNK